MEWYLILLIVLLSFGGLICAVVICLHIFECSYILKHRRGGAQLSDDFTFNLSDSTSGGGTTFSQIDLPPSNSVVVPNFQSSRHQREYSYPTSPSTFLSYSDGSTTSPSTASSFPSPTFSSYPATPQAAHMDPSLSRGSGRHAFVSFDRLRGRSHDSDGNKKDDEDLEAQDASLHDTLAKVGW